ncbi:MAG: hypothetical protein KBC96_01250 [Armatimonadetes bacterium]|nr:hypothetical protein [Armatimonadota bacterium]
MPAKYHIHTAQAPPKHKVIGKYGIVDWREDCSACHNCVKRECAYSVYDGERDRLQGASDYVDYLYECKGCLCCVQSCTKGLLTQEVNPEFEGLGDGVWTPDIISGTWFQAETGRIPVSGAGYAGPFMGPGFDAILTDMSEIVRPTRDGIHGREYISTQVEIGRKLPSLSFNPDGSLAEPYPTQIDVPIPILFDLLPWHTPSEQVTRAMLDAAEALGTRAVTDTQMDHDAAAPHVRDGAIPSGAPLVEWSDSSDVVRQVRQAREANGDLVAMVRLPLGADSIARALELTEQGVDAIHSCADWHGNATDGTHITRAVQALHQAFVERGNRDAVTIVSSGGIALAEHVAKTIICGADAVAVDIPLMIALECRVCRNCTEGIQCPVGLADIDHDYAVQRIVNLIGAWHSQLLEMMGAMGIREVRRLRGEVGRAMFFEDLERDCFGPIFGTRKVQI